MFAYVGLPQNLKDLKDWLSLQEGRVVGLCWAKLKPKGPKVLSTEGRVVGPCWEKLKPKGPKGGLDQHLSLNP